MPREKLPNRRLRTPIEFEHWQKEFKGGAGHYANGEVGEVFLSAGKTGTELQIATCDAAIAASIALQYGATVEELRTAFLREEDGIKPAGPMGKLFDLLAGGVSDGQGSKDSKV